MSRLVIDTLCHVAIIANPIHVSVRTLYLKITKTKPRGRHLSRSYTAAEFSGIEATGRPCDPTQDTGSLPEVDRRSMFAVVYR